MIQEFDVRPNSVATTTNSALSNQDNQSLRCPRCDSSNTKFCYYNNYNLTQPRHFCKTCRRYWTKGGALRNVPIGGGCRKNKTNYISTPLGKSNVGIHNNVAKTAIGLGLNHHHHLHHMFDHDHFASNYNINNPNGIWASPQNSHILALVKASQNPSPNPNPSPVGLFSDGSEMMNDSSGAFNTLPLWRNNPHQLQNQQQNGFNNIVGIQEMYLKMKTSNNYYATSDDQGVMCNFGGATTSSASSSILESAPVGGCELGYNNWNSAYSSWSELPTANAAYP